MKELKTFKFMDKCPSEIQASFLVMLFEKVLSENNPIS